MQLISGIRSGLLWARGALAGFGLRDGARDFVEIGRREIELPGSDPAVYLCGGSRADNRSGDAAPAERPGDGDGGNAYAVPRSDGTKRVAETKVAAELRLQEFGGFAAPIVVVKLRHSLGREGIG